MKNNPHQPYRRFAVTSVAACANPLPGKARYDAGLSVPGAAGGHGFQWPDHASRTTTGVAS